MRLRSLLRDPLFLGGLAARLLMVALAAPTIQSHWFAPFLQLAPRFGLAPWGGFLQAGGDPAAFPYGFPYLVAFAPGVWLGEFVGGETGGRIGLGLGVLGWDLVLLSVLLRLVGRERSRAILAAYWLSPIAVYVGYWHGQLDVFPVALVATAFLAVRERRLAVAGALFGVAAAAKISMAAPLPFVAIYLLGRPRLRGAAARPVATFAVTIAALLAPFALLEGFRRMVLQTPESAKAFSLAVTLGPGLGVYVLPLAYLALVYAAWRVRRLDFPLLWSFTGVGFMALLLLTPASPGWAMWPLPFLALYAARSARPVRGLYAGFCVLFVALHLLISEGARLGGLDLSAPLALRLADPGKSASVLLTLALGAGAGLAALLVRSELLYAPFRLAMRRPFVVGVSGDSGSGKDTLVDSVRALFGPGAVAHVSGDDYHVWDRHKPMWRAMTHLDPRANDLDAFARNVETLAGRQPVVARHYDHATGRMTRPQRLAPAELVVASGLHALWSPALNALYDVRLYLDMDEDLRRFLKMRRDVRDRGHPPARVLAAIERRFGDAVRYVHPQAAAADVVLRLERRRPADEGEDVTANGLRLVVRARPGQSFDVLARLLTALCGMQVIETSRATGEVEVFIEGEPTVDDIAAAARHLVPDLEEVLGLDPRFQPELRGVMQLVVLDQLDRARRRRSAAA